MDGTGIGDFGGRNQRRYVEITLRRSRRTNAHGFVCQFHVFGFDIRLGMRGDGADAQLAAGTQHAQGDFAPVGNQDFLEHAYAPAELNR